MDAARLPASWVPEVSLTTRWIPQRTGTGGPGMLRQKQETMAMRDPGRPSEEAILGRSLA